MTKKPINRPIILKNHIQEGKTGNGFIFHSTTFWLLLLLGRRRRRRRISEMQSGEITAEQRARITHNFRAAKALLARKRPRHDAVLSNRSLPFAKLVPFSLSLSVFVQFHVLGVTINFTIKKQIIKIIAH